MRAVSKKRAKELRVYSSLRVKFLEANPLCQFPKGCPAAATTIQHVRGRRGARLLDVTWWKASCWACNEWAETNTGEALACGWLVRIESVA